MEIQQPRQDRDAVPAQPSSGHVVIPAEERTEQVPRDFKEFLLHGPSFDDLDLTRDSTPTRIVEL